MSKAPTHIYLKVKETGELVPISTSIFPSEFVPEIWFENPFWRYSRYLSKDEVMKFLEKKPLTQDEAYKLGRYILLYTQNLACMGWLFSEDREGYFKFMLPCIRKLRQILSKVKSRDEVYKMLDVCLEYGLDPI